MTPARAAWEVPPGRRVTVGGLVLVRQRPGSAKGVVFMTLEDETGFANLIVWPPVFERYRAAILTARLLACAGMLQREGRVMHVVAERLTDQTAALRHLREEAVDPSVIDGAMSRADEIRRDTRELWEALPGSRDFR